MHVIFLAPHFPANQRRFVKALHEAGAAVTGIGDAPLSALDNDLKSWMIGYEEVASVGDAHAVVDAVRRIQRRGPWVDRFEATIESHVLIAAAARAQTGIPGLSVATTNLCRDKFVMKNFLRERGIPCAKNAAITSGEDAWRFAREAGYPFILKPRDGAGAAHTYRLDDDDALRAAIAETALDQGGRYFTAEEFMTGHEGFVDTLTCNGEVVFEGICHYYPNVLEGMRTRWISPQIVLTNRIDAPGYDGVRSMARQVIREMDITTSATHMEWFYGPKGLAFSEIGARPPGCQLWDLYCAANDFDLYLEWAKAVVHGRVAPRPSRRFAAGLVSLRPDQDGVIKGYSGVDEIMRRHGEHVLKWHLPPVGSRTNPVGAGYLGHAWAWARHPDYDQCREILDDIGRTVHVWAG